MGNSVLIKLQAEDNLTPTLRQDRDELARLHGSIRELDTALRTMRANRAGIISGDIRSDIAEISRLQDELQRVRATGNRSDIRRAEAELRRALTTETNNLTAALRGQRDEYQRLSIVTSRAYEHYRRQQAAAQRATEANNRDTQSLRNNNAVRSSSINSLVRHIRQVETLVLSVYGLKRAYDVLLGSGINLHRQIESQTAGIAALITANTRLASGSKDLAKHFKIASQTAEQTMKKIKSASVETAATFPELTAIFQQAVGGALGAGKAMGDTIEKQIDNTIALSKRMSNIASAIGMPMVQVNEEIRSIIEGTIDINSRIAKMIGITNEQIRKAKTEKDGLVKYLNEKLKPFDALADIQSFDRMVARIKDNIDNIKLDATEEAFKQIKLHLKDLNDWLAANRGELAKNIASGVKNTADAIKTAVIFVKEWKDEILLLAKAFVVFKAGGWVVGGIESLITNFRRASETLGLVTTSATGATRAVNILKTALFALRGALAGIAIYGAIELFAHLSKKVKQNKIDFEKLNAVLAKTNEELNKLSAPELSRDENVLSDARKKIADQIYDTYRRIQEAKQEGGIGSEDMIGFYEKNLEALAAKLKRIDDQLKKVKDSKKEAAEAEKKYNQSLKEQKEYLEAVSKLTPDIQKLLEKYGKEFYDSKAEENLANVRRQIEGVKKAILEASDPQVTAGLINVFKALRNIEDGLEQKAIDDKKAAKEKAANEAKQAHAEAMRRAKEKADWQIKHAKAVGDTEKAFRLELQQYEKELQDLIVKGYITRTQKADLLRQKEKEHHEKRLKEQKELNESFEKEFNDRRNAQKDFYAAIGEYEKAAVIAAEFELKKLVELAQKAGIHINKELGEKLKKIAEENAKKGFEKFNKEAKKSFKDIKNSWADTVSSMQKTVEDGFFNFFIGKTKSLKKALKDIGTNLMRDFISPYARALSQGLAGGFGSFLGGGSNLASIASNLGLAKNNSGGWSGSVGGTPVELSSTGQILRGADALDKSTTNLLGSISNLQSAYQALTSGYKGLVSKFTGAPMNYIGTRLSLAGYDSLGLGFQGFGAGAQHALTGSILNGGGLNGSLSGAYSGAYAGGAALGGAALGYGVGYLGDRLFKANTHASSVGAVGGALGGAASAGAFGAKIGSSVGPWGAVIGAVAGALIGGAFGKKKATGSGISVLQDINAGDTLSNKNIRSYVDMQKKGWFSKKSWSELSDLDDASMREIGAQLNTMNRLASRAGALATLKLSAGKYSGGSLANEGLAKAILRSMTGQAEQTWAEVTQTSTKRKGLFGKLTGIFEKTFKFSPSTISDRLTKPLDDAITKSMNKVGLGELDKMARGGRGEYGKLLDGNIFGMGATRKLDDLLNLTRDETKVNQRLVDNPEFSRMWKDWEEQAKKANKKVIELMGESLGAIADTYKRLELLSVKNPIKQVETSMRQAFESFTDAAQALKLDIPKQMGSIADLSVEQMALAYRKAIASDFTKSNIDSLNSLVKAYEAARKAQDDYTKAILNFTQQVASTQAGFYSAHGIDSSFMNYQNIYTKFRTLIGALDKDIGEGHKQGVLKNGSFGDINSWAKHFLGLSSNELGGFLSGGNTELRQELLKLLTEYQNQVKSTGGHQFWLKSMADLEAINKQIETLKLAQKAQSAQEQLKANAKANLDAQRAQLDLLKAQKSAVEKLANIVQKIRDKVIDRATSPINYQTALEKARQAYAKGDYQSKAFDNLSSAADKQGQYFEETSLTYEEYKLNMLKMAGEIEGMAGGKSLEDINRAILEVEERIKKATKIFEEEFKNLNKTGQDQLAALEAQRQSLIENAKAQLDHMNTLLGASSPMVKYLRDILQYLIKPEIGKDGKPKAPNIPNYTTPGNVNNGITTANGALLSSALDKTINQTYLSVLGRSVEQQGLDYWRDRIKRGDTTAQGLGAELAKMAQALTGSNDRQVWIEWAKSKGYKPFAQGGIVTRPTRALIGEAGYPEAVIPLKGGNGVKVDMDGGFRILQRGIERLESVVRGMAKDIKEMALTDRGTTNGDERLVRLVGIPTVRIEK